VVLIVHGGISLWKITDLRKALDNDNLSDLVPMIVIAIGVFIFVISFVGCCGAMQGNICLLETYSIFMLILVLFQVVLACLVLLFSNDIRRDSAISFNRLWKSRAYSKSSTMMMDLIQENLECCGSNNALDYTINTIPISCCKQGTEFCTPETAYSIGCRNHLLDSIKSSAQTIGYMCLVSAVFELIASIMGFILSSYKRKVNAIRRCCY
jgi:CD63 antigen